ncbi:MAG: M23 family metallopeptidase [Bacteroidota bacterium]
MNNPRTLFVVTIFSSVLFFFAVRLMGQTPALRSPLDIPLSVVGTFGELRPDHFHTGIDFTTKGESGKNIYAVADGYVSRIKISATGYGRAIYINHPGGFTSVYGHLEAFNVLVDDYIRRKQYEKKSFEIDFSPDEALFPVHKGDIIGYSGNSGASEGPHLHFEIRNSRTEHPENPMLFGIGAADNIGPQIEKIRLYPLRNNSRVEGKAAIMDVEIIKKDSLFIPKEKDTLVVSGSFYLGLLAEDPQNGSAETGLYSVRIFADGGCFYAWSMDSLDFAQGRFVNTFIDYAEYKKTGNRFITTLIQPGNRLPIYSTNKSDGILSFGDTLIHAITVVAADFAGNKSALRFYIKSSNASKAEEKIAESTNKKVYYYGMSNKYEGVDIIVEIPPNALYDSVLFNCDQKKALPGAFSKTYAVLDKFTPVHSYINISIKPDKEVAPQYRDKLVMVYSDGPARLAVKGLWENGFYTARVRRFGDYSLLADTIPPKLKALNFTENKNVSGQTDLKVKISDELSGISSYNAYLNGQWILMEYDAKNDLLTYKIDEKATTGKNEFLLDVTDVCGNKSTLKIGLRF